MRRIEMAGLCAVSVLVLAALLASGAQAAEYGQCRALTTNTTPKAKHGRYEDENCQKLFEKKGTPKAKGNFEWVPGPPANCVALKHGEYTDAGCATKSSKPHKGSFEKQPCSPKCATFVGRAEFVEPEFTSVAGTVRCSVATTSKGEITGPKTGVEVVTYQGCHEVGGEEKQCQDLSEVTPGQVVTSPLETRLIGYGEMGPGEKSPSASAEVWQNVENRAGAHAPYLADFFCEGSGFGRDKGNIAGIVDPFGGTNKMETASLAGFNPKAFEQNLLADLGCTNTSYSSCAATNVPLEELFVVEDKYTTRVEIKT
jgi:hypothetical protein